MLTLFTAGLLLLQTSAATFYLRPADRVVFYGDSITEQRLYTMFVETYVVTRFPAYRVQFTHSGWGGDRVTGGGGGTAERRVARDVIPYKPTVMTVMLGMNDGSYRPFDQNIFDTYSTGYRRLIGMVKKDLPDIRLTLIQPSPFDDVTRPPTVANGGYNQTLLRYSTFVKELAASESCLTADLNSPVVEGLKRANAADKENALKLIPDRVHPLEGGHLMMAAELLQAWNAPARVSSVEIDAAASGKVSAEGAKVRRNSTLSWTQTDSALPFPVNLGDPVQRLAVSSCSFQSRFNQQKLAVKGLTGVRYGLFIDGEKVGTFSSQQLQDGINLADLETPMMKQAREVHRLTVRHNDLHYRFWRQILVPFEKENPALLAKALSSLKALEADIVARQRAAAQPKPHTFELKAE